MASADVESTKDEVKKNDVDSQGAADLTHTVAKHYNELQDAGLKQRGDSRIFYMRNFNNWVKSILIGDILNRLKKELGTNHGLSVLDLCGGKGGDLLKWKKGNIHNLVLADIAATSVEQAESRFKEMRERAKRERYRQSVFSAQFYAADCTKVRLKERYPHPQKYDLVSCQFSFHYSFESYQQADMMMRNACECLRPGGYFVGTTPNAQELVKRLRLSEDMSFGNSIYRVTFHGNTKDNLPLFGAKYDFHLEGVVDCPEFLVYFPALEKLAEKYGMKLMFKKTFHEFFNDYIKTDEGRGLIGRMQALEPYPADGDVELMSKEKTSYTNAHQVWEALKQEQRDQDQRQQHHRRRRESKVGTLSQEEWDATSIYLVFAFQKAQLETAEKSSQETRKRPHDQEENGEPSPSKHLRCEDEETKTSDT